MPTQIDIRWVSDERLVPFYLMASYLYYQWDVSLFTDSGYDTLCCRLLATLPAQRHRHTKLVSASALHAGTGYHIAAKLYPTQVQGAALSLAAKCGLL